MSTTANPNCFMCRGEGEYASFSPAEMVRCGCRAASPSPASPADDVAGLIEPVAYRQWARVTEYGGCAVKRIEWLGEPEPLVPAAALSRLQAELDKALQTIEVWDSDREAAKANWVKHGATEIALGQWRARAENAEARLAEVTAERDEDCKLIGELRTRIAQLQVAEASAATMREALTKAGVIAFEMRARDKRNGILTDWWRERLDALIAALGGQHG